MRVLMIIPSFRPLVGGAERQLEGLAAELTSDKVSVLVVTRQLLGAQRREHLQGFNILRLPSGIPKIGFAISLLFFLIWSRRNFDIIHCHTLSGPAIVSVIVARLTKKPVILKVTRSGAGSQLDRFQSSKIRLLVLTIMARWTDRFIAITKDVENALREAGIQRQKIVGIPNGVAIPDDPVVKKENNIKIVFVGRLIPRKRVDWLIRSYSFAPTSRGSKLVVIGDGPEQKKLSTLATELKVENKVEFKGQFRKDQVEAELASADIFVLPSTSEGMSNALLEAMANRLAVVAADIPQNRELITENLNGCLFETPEDLSLVLAKLVSNDCERRRLGKNAHQLIQQKYDFGIVARGYHDLYRTILE